jgi:hypothetical protein
VTAAVPVRLLLGVGLALAVFAVMWWLLRQPTYHPPDAPFSRYTPIKCNTAGADDPSISPTCTNGTSRV